MKNEFHIKALFPELTLELVVGKSKKNTKTSVLYKNLLMKKFETEDALKDINVNDGDRISVRYNQKELISDDGQIVIPVTDKLIDNGIIIDLIKTDRGIDCYFGDILLDSKRVDYFGNLFTPKTNYNCAARNSYKAFVTGEGPEKDEIRIQIVRYVNTHQHTEYSRLDGMTKIKDIAKKTEWAGAITDHGVMTGVLKFEDLMLANGKKPIIGIEPYIERIDENIFNDIFVDYSNSVEEENQYKKEHFKREHIIMLAKNEIGYNNLVKLASKSWDNFYSKNHIKYSDLVNLHEGIIATSACLGSTIGRNLIEDEKNIRKQFFKEINFEEENYTSAEEDDLIANDELILNSNEIAFLEDKFNIKDNFNIDLSKNVFSKDLILNIVSKFKLEVPKTIELINSYGRIPKMYIQKMIDIFGRDDFYIEIQRHKFASEEYIEKILLDYAKKHNLKIVTGIDNHYLNKEDKDIHEMWLCESTGKTLNDEKRLRFPGEGYYLMNSSEVLDLFEDIPEAMDNSLEIAEKCNVSLKRTGYSLPKFPLPEGFGNSMEEQQRYFKTMVFEGYKNRFFNTNKYNNSIYTERMTFEMKTIKKMGFESYFLIVQDYISWAKDKNVKENIERYFPKSQYDYNLIPDKIKNKNYEIYVGPGRGSAAGSLVAYCLGITDINPIEYNLLFERFLNPDRISMPDIDTDFEDSKREEVINYIKIKYGENCVSRIGTIGTLAARGVIRAIQRVTGSNIDLANQITKLIPNKPGITLKMALEESPELAQLVKTNSVVKDIYDKAEKLEGLSKSAGSHACGILIAPSNVDDFIPQQLLKNPQTGEKELTTQFTGPECEDQGLLKMDFLGLRTLGTLHENIDDINKISNDKIDLVSIPIEEFDVYKFLSTGETDGVFQFESPFMKDIVKKMLQDINSNKNLNGNMCFNRLADATALGRPGPMATIPDYVANLLNVNNIKKTNTPLDDILKDTYGIIVYQEQVMQAVKALAGFSAGDADGVRKAMGKKLIEKMNVLREYFIYGNQDKNIPGCIKNGYSEQFAIDLWDRMAEFAKYAFNKSHAVAYTYVSMKTAWVAYHYPNIFMKGILNSFINSNKKIKRYIATSKTKGIEVLTPDVNKSEEYFGIDYDNYSINNPIRFGLKGIKTLGNSSKDIILERNTNGEFKDFIDFIHRMVNNYNFSKANFKALIYAGATDSFGGTRKDKIDDIERLVDLVKSDADERKNGQMTIFKLAEELNNQEFLIQYQQLNSLNIKNVEFDELERLAKENEYTGFYITGHPIYKYKTILDKQSDLVKINTLILEKDEEEDLIEDDTSIIETVIEEKDVIVVGIIKDLVIRYSKKDNKKMKTFIIEDDTAEIKCVAFSKTVEEYDNLIKENNIVMLSGKVTSDDFGTQIIISKVEDIESINFLDRNMELDCPNKCLNKCLQILKKYETENKKFTFVKVFQIDEVTESKLNPSFKINNSPSFVEDITKLENEGMKIRYSSN